MRILLEAPILTQSGYGEHSRLIYRAIKDLQPVIHLAIRPLNWGRTSWSTLESTEERKSIEKCIDRHNNYVNQAKRQRADFRYTELYDFHIFVGILNEHERKGHRSVCVTAGIETDRVAPEWLIKTIKQVDKLIVPSEHAKLGFTKTSYKMQNESTGLESVLECACPVDVVPYPVKEIESQSLDFSLDTDFNFLTVALLGPRKNFKQLVRNFIKEFQHKNVGLVIKQLKQRVLILIK